MPWIGLDDTDTLSGGCTTYEFHLLIQSLTKSSREGSPWGIPSDSRLVRLWPFASKRTRGNAALASKIEINKENETQLFEYLDAWYRELIERVSKLKVIQSHHSNREQAAPEPCLIFSRKQYPDFYWSAVRGNINIEYAESLISKDKNVRIWGDERKRAGLIGGLAAISWIGLNDHTWELTAYRNESMYSKERVLVPKTVINMSNQYSNTILNRDPNSEKTLISPRTPCPVLYGIRSECSDEAINAHKYLQSITGNEQCKSFQVWRTNQATGDHIKEEFQGHLTSNPKINRGGHISIEVKGVAPDYQNFVLMAFHEAGPLNKLATVLKMGDLIAWQGLKSPSGEIHLERLKLIQATPREKKRPKCSCGNKLKSAGKNQSLRCEKCELTYPRLWVGKKIKPSYWVEPNPSERRHLAKPLDRN